MSADPRLEEITIGKKLWTDAHTSFPLIIKTLLLIVDSRVFFYAKHSISISGISQAEFDTIIKVVNPDHSQLLIILPALERETIYASFEFTIDGWVYV